jgi:hypothetical protein
MKGLDFFNDRKLVIKNREEAYAHQRCSSKMLIKYRKVLAPSCANLTKAVNCLLIMQLKNVKGKYVLT